MTYRAAVAVLPGFTQRLTPRIGLGKLYDRLESGPCRDRTHTWLGMRTWDGDHEATAAWIKKRMPERVIAIAYSYGAGWALRKLAAALSAEGMVIHHAYLIDPVPRFRFLPAKVISLTRMGTLTLPGNVVACDYWRQLNGSPYGRRVVHPDRGDAVTCRGLFGAAGSYRHAHAGERRTAAVSYRSDVGHAEIDDQPEIHDFILDDIARRLA